MRNYNTDDFTHLCEPEADLDIWQCNNCGAHADKKEDVKHYPKCVSGDAKKWEKFYEDANEEDNKDNEV